MEPTARYTGAEREINPLTKNIFTFPGRPSFTPPHPTDTCTVSPVKVAPGAPPTTAFPAYHSYQMPMVQNSYTKAVENSNMPAPHFSGHQRDYDEWVEKLYQWLGGCDPAYRKANEARMVLSTLPPWLKGIINTRVAEGTQHQRTMPTLKELWDFLEHRYHEYDPSRADERWRALEPRVVKGKVSIVDLEDFFTRWQRMLPLTNETRPHVVREVLLAKLPWIKEKVVEKEAKLSQGSCTVDFSGLDPSPGRAPFENELKRYCSRYSRAVPEIVSYAGPGAIVDCKDPELLEWVLQLNNSPHANGHTMKVERRRPRLQPADIYALAYKEVSKRESLERLDEADKTTVTYAHKPSPHKTAVHAVNADATADSSGAEPTDTSVNAVGLLNPRQRKPPAPIPINPFGFHVPSIGKSVNKRKWTTVLIGVPPIAPFGCVDPIPRAITPIGRFLRPTSGPSKGVSLKVESLSTLVAIRAIRAVGATREARGRRIGADVGRSAMRSPLRKKQTSGARMMLRWLSFLRGS